MNMNRRDPNVEMYTLDKNLAVVDKVGKNLVVVDKTYLVPDAFYSRL
jgi:hypothetical protein